MLTTTYSLIALSVEQKNARGSLSALQQCIKNSADHSHEADPVALASAVDKLSQLDQYCHERKVEVYVIPAIRKVTREADFLLAELEQLNSAGVNIVQSVRANMHLVYEQGALKIEELCKSMERYCSNLYQRLIREEELFKIAQRVISFDEWFAIATNFLSYDAENSRRRRYDHIAIVAA